jgi:hypothetical protein
MLHLNFDAELQGLRELYSLVGVLKAGLGGNSIDMWQYVVLKVVGRSKLNCQFF